MAETGVWLMIFSAAYIHCDLLACAGWRLEARSWLADLVVCKTWWSPVHQPQHRDIANSAPFSQDGRRVVTASWANTAQVLTPIAASLGGSLQLKDSVDSAALSVDGWLVATGADDQTARVYQLQPAPQVRRAEIQTNLVN